MAHMESGFAGKGKWQPCASESLSASVRFLAWDGWRIWLEHCYMQPELSCSCKIGQRSSIALANPLGIITTHRNTWVHRPEVPRIRSNGSSGSGKKNTGTKPLPEP